MQLFRITYAALVLVSISASSCLIQRSPNFQVDKAFAKTVGAHLADAASQYKIIKANLPADKLPKTFEKGALVTSNSDWWCSGFYPGTLYYLYENTKDSELYNEANRTLKILEKEQYNKTTHDLGFMMFCSFGNANRIEPKPEYKNILINSAKSLSTRFNPKIGAIKSWDSNKNEYLVIIDNMMNLELLFWATRVTGDSSFYKIAETHANTTIANHFRPDYSSYHVLNYNPQTGKIQQKRTAQGFADESAWARGQAWGLYGFTVMYRETKNKKYLEQAQHIADFYLNHPNLPADKVPYWDFNAPDIPNALRDASAAAITASALLELGKYTNGKMGRKYLGDAEAMLKSLSSAAYKAKPGTNGGFILEHGLGHKPAGTEIDVPLTYGDYYYVEALHRYTEMIK